ncbi:protein PAT1 homolog 2 isoform X2 [Rana temporaria]|uniref:protein PAT1 homolog 2 isoform X2 n=1 Tax=Rana temporaria TaxID=8407 RepID=UPI001AACA881|nr:protein PAT1 homolog 2 isoform X2 [Rana temporaria]
MSLNSDQILPEDFYLAEENSVLEEMAEEDDEIDLYNEVTFGLDHEESEDEGGKEENQSKKADQKPELTCEYQELSEKQRELVEFGEETINQEVEIVTEYLKDADLSLEMENRRESTRIDDSEWGDPAVMKAFHAQPALESVDSAVVDSGIGSTWTEFDTDYDLTTMDSSSWMGSPKVTLTRAGQILEDKAILRVMDKAPYLPPANLEFLGSPMHRGYMCAQRLKGLEMGRLSPKPFRQRFPRQSPLMPRSMRPPFPFTPPRRPIPPFSPNQSPGFMSQTPFRPMSPNVSTPVRPMTPKMVRMQFGPMSPSPSMSPFFSPLGNTFQSFKFPGHVTQLHPQHRRILSQRQRPQSSSRKQWDSRPDPYASLMSQKEKEWVIKLQMIQLQSENPHLDDYYYQTYYEKLERRLAEEEFLGERKKKEPPKLVTPYIQKAETYESVVHFEGSLGQVAVSTCYSPRRAIDAISYVMPDEDIKALGYQRLRVLKHIEKLFIRLLEVEETERKIHYMPGDQHHRYQQKQSYKVQSIYEALKIAVCSCEDESEDEFLQILQVGKGKKLVARLLKFLHSEQTVEILLTVVQHLSYLIKNDTTEKSLPVLYGPLTSIVNELPFTELIRVIQELTTPLPGSPDLPLRLAFQNQFGISLLYALLSHGESLLSSDTPMEPCIGDFEKWTDTVFLVAKELSHVSKSSMVEPLFLPSNLLSLFCRYLDKQTIHKLEDKMECPTAPPYSAVPS